MTYDVVVRYEPKTGAAGYDDPGFRQATSRVTDMLRSAFAGRCGAENVETSPAGYVSRLVLTTEDQSLVVDVHRRVWSEDLGPVEPVVVPHLPEDPKTIVRARWVCLDTDSARVDTGSARYGRLCQTCGFPDADNPPNPYPVGPDILKPRYQKLDIMHCDNGIFAVRDHVFDLLQSYIKDEITSGRICIDGQAEPLPGYRWIRPKHKIELFMDLNPDVPRCSACGALMEFRATTMRPGQIGLPSYGDPAPNIALAGRYSSLSVPRPYRNTVRQRTVDVSGGLYAVLVNAKVKGLSWPHGGPIISAKPGEPWLQERRFNIFKPREDKILKKVVTYKHVS